MFSWNVHTHVDSLESHAAIRALLGFLHLFMREEYILRAVQIERTPSALALMPYHGRWRRSFHCTIDGMSNTALAFASNI